MFCYFKRSSKGNNASLSSFAGSPGYAAMSLLLGGLVDSMGPAKALFILTLISLPVIYLYWIIFKNDRKTTS